MAMVRKDNEKAYDWAAALFFICFAYLACYQALYGHLDIDEGAYLQAARLVYNGRLPYRDFLHVHPPLVPYVYGIPQLCCHGVLMGRLTSVVCGLATLLLSWKLARKVSGHLGALITVAILTFTFKVVWTFSVVRTEPLAILLVMSGLYCFLALPREPARSILSTGCLVAATAARISCLPAALLALGMALYQNRHAPRTAAKIVASTVGLVALLFGPFLWADPQAMVFNIYTFQRYRDAQWGNPLNLNPWKWFYARVCFSADCLIRWFPSAVLALTVLVPFTLGRSASDKRRHLTYWTMLGLAAVLYIPNLVAPNRLIETYFVPSFVVLAIFCGCAIADYRRRLSGTPAASLLMAIAVALVITQGLDFIAHHSGSVNPTSPQLGTLREVARYVASVTPPEGQVVTLDTYLAVEAGCRVAPGLDRNYFSYFPHFSDQEAARYHVVNDHLLAQAMLDKATTCVLLTDHAIQLISEKEMQPGRFTKPLSEDDLYSRLPMLRGEYTLTRVVPDFGAWHDNLYVLVRKSRARSRVTDS